MTTFAISPGNENVQNYYAQKYNSANPNPKNVQKYTVKKGDNLWNIAKEHLNKKNASNADVSNMMYQIAKLNKKQTIESANNIKADEVLLLPKSVQIQSSKTSAAEQQTKTNNIVKSKKTQPVQQHQQSQHSQLSTQAKLTKTRNEVKQILFPDGEILTYSQKNKAKLENKDKINNKLYAQLGKDGASAWTEMLADPNSKLINENSYTYKSTPTGLIISKKDNNQRYGNTVAQMLVQVDDNGKVSEVAYNVPELNINPIRFDYVVDSKGNIKRPSSFGHYQTIDQMPQEDHKKFINQLQNYVDKNLKK